MRRQFLFGTVFAAAMAVGVGAQSTAQSSSQYDRGDTVTVTGCLQSAEGTTGTTGTGSSAATAGSETSSAASSMASGQFKLTNVSMGPSSGTTAGETPQTATGTTGTTGMGNDLLLIASSSSTNNWSKYLNHRVEVRGTLEKKESNPPESSANPTSTNPTSTNPTGTSGSTAGTMTGSTSASSASQYGNTSNADMSKLRVSSIKDLGTTCSSK